MRRGVSVMVCFGSQEHAGKGCREFPEQSPRILTLFRTTGSE